MKKIAQVAIIKPLHNLFDYEIPEEFGNIEPGMRVSVEFGRKLVLGFVVKVKKYDNSLGYKNNPSIIEKSASDELFAVDFTHMNISHLQRLSIDMDRVMSLLQFYKNMGMASTFHYIFNEYGVSIPHLRLHARQMQK